jgi:hypothetical protein
MAIRTPTCEWTSAAAGDEFGQKNDGLVVDLVFRAIEQRDRTRPHRLLDSLDRGVGPELAEVALAEFFPALRLVSTTCAEQCSRRFADRRASRWRSSFAQTD